MLSVPESQGEKARDQFVATMLLNNRSKLLPEIRVVAEASTWDQNGKLVLKDDVLEYVSGLFKFRTLRHKNMLGGFIPQSQTPYEIFEPCTEDLGLLSLVLHWLTPDQISFLSEEILENFYTIYKYFKKKSLIEKELFDKFTISLASIFVICAYTDDPIKRMNYYDIASILTNASTPSPARTVMLANIAANQNTDELERANAELEWLYASLKMGINCFHLIPQLKIQNEVFDRLPLHLKLGFQKVYTFLLEKTHSDSIAVESEKLKGLTEKYHAYLREIPSYGKVFKIIDKPNQDALKMSTTLKNIPIKLFEILKDSGCNILLQKSDIFIGPLSKNSAMRVLSPEVLAYCIRTIVKAEQRLYEQSQAQEKTKLEQPLELQFASLRLTESTPSLPMPSSPAERYVDAPTYRQATKNLKNRVPKQTPPSPKGPLVPVVIQPREQSNTARSLMFSYKYFRDNIFYPCRTRGMRLHNIWVVLGEWQGEIPDSSTKKQMEDRFKKAKIVPARGEKGFKFIGKVLCLKDTSAYRLFPLFMQRNITGKDVAYYYGYCRDTKTGLGSRDLEEFAALTCKDLGTKGKKDRAPSV